MRVATSAHEGNAIVISNIEALQEPFSVKRGTTMIHTIRLRTFDFTIKPEAQLRTICKIDENNELLTERLYYPYSEKSFRINVSKPKTSMISTLYIEGELPSLISDDPLYHITEADCDKIVDKLTKFCNKVGINISEEAIRNATIIRIDFMKDFTMNDSPSRYIRFLSKSSTSHMNRVYTNDETITFKNSDVEVSAYDKTKHLAETYHRSVKPNILRFEVRLKSKRSVRTHIGKEKVTLESVFSKELSENILVTFFDRITKNISTVPHTFSYSDQVRNIVTALNKENVTRNRGFMTISALLFPSICEELGSSKALISLLHQGGVYSRQQALRDTRCVRNLLRHCPSNQVNPTDELRLKLKGG